jgi:hypothetical protein
MRYFQRAGPSVVVAETPERARMVKGPSADGPGERVSYNEAYEDEARWADAMAADPGWFEVDRNGDQLGLTPLPATTPTEATSTEAAEPATTESE